MTDCFKCGATPERYPNICNACLDAMNREIRHLEFMLREHDRKLLDMFNIPKPP